MVTELSFDQDEVACGSTLRHLLPLFVDSGEIAFDDALAPSLNSVVLCRVIEVPAQGATTPPFRSNYIERVYFRNGCHTFASEEVRVGQLVLAVTGCRYSELSFIGGFYNPATQALNPPLLPGQIAVNLGALNLVGHLNYSYGTENPIQVRVLGTLREPADLRGAIKPSFTSSGCGTRSGTVVLVLGSGMETGKTTCALALADAMRGAGRRVSFEKKTGGPFCKDWINVCEAGGNFGPVGTSVSINLTTTAGGDFLDACGIPSSHSTLSFESFARNSAEYTCQLLRSTGSECHIIELAGNILQEPNLAVLHELSVDNLVDWIVLAASRGYDTTVYSLSFLRRIFPRIGVIVSGPMANDDWNAGIRDELKRRVGVLVIPCATRSPSGRYKPNGSELARLIREGGDSGTYALEQADLFERQH